MLNHILSLRPASIQAQYGWHMYSGPGAMMGWGVWGIFHAIFWLAILVAVATACIMMLRRSGAGRSGDGNDARPSALEQLDERYARGEIDREDYLQRKNDILKR